MKILSWALMLIGVVCVAVSLVAHLPYLGLGGGLLTFVGELVPRNGVHLPPPRARSRPEVRRTVETGKPQEKSA